MSKKIRFITPALTLVWPKLNEPDVYKPKRGPEKVRYVTDGKLETADLKKVKAYLAGLAKKHLADVSEPKMPFKTDKKTGDLLITASSGVKYRPPVFDAKNNKIPADVVIGGGSTAKLDLTVNFFEISDENSGINLYINAVQVLDLQEGGFGKSNFEEAEGFSYKGAAGFGDGADNASDEGDTDDGESTYKF